MSVLPSLLAVASIAVIHGVATYYAPGVMDRVVRNRISWGQLSPNASGPFVAVLDCDCVGGKAWIWWERERIFQGPFTIADCASVEDVPALLAKGFAVDVQWEIAKARGMRGPVPVRVFLRCERPRQQLRYYLGLRLKNEIR